MLESDHRLVSRSDRPPACVSQHSQRLHVGFQDGLLLLPLVGILLAQAYDATQCLDVEAVALALGIDIANIVGNRLFSSSSRSMRSMMALS